VALRRGWPRGKIRRLLGQGRTAVRRAFGVGGAAASQITERTGERWLAAELSRQKGELLLRQGNSAGAEALYGKALTIAAEQGAKFWELRAAASLARLRRRQGRRAEARDVLAPIYGWFTEGFNTADLIEAKAPLDELT
jgi:predicted ATPase